LEFILFAHNGQGLLQGWNSLLVRPEPLLIKDIKVQVNKQKPNDVCPAQMKHNSDKMPIAPMSCQPCSKPNVACSTFLSQRQNYCQ
jgi:ferredoxin-like protein FixX